MSFNTLVFPVFFAIVFGLFWATPWLTGRKVILLVFSYVFYSSFQPSHLFILIGLTLFNFALAFPLNGAKGRMRLAILVFAVSTNLSTLAFFKYIDFLLTNLNSVFAAGLPIPTILLPIGISFYVFEVISYVADIYRRKIVPERSLLDFALLLAFFPRLMAGPIVRPADFLPQLKVVQAPELAPGLKLVLIGLFQKLFIADFVMAPVVDWYFRVWTHVSAFDSWMAIIAFAFQIYCDFNGYTLCGIGLALLLGFRLPTNFNSPYAAIGLSDFWRRWHISLSTWIRDYLYIPLGGSRHGQLRTCLSLLTAMTLAGLWHGASWNFVIWGLIHGVLLCVEHTLRSARQILAARAGLVEQIVSSPAAVVVSWAVTFIVVCITWVPFRAPSWESAIAMLYSMTKLSDFVPRNITAGDATLVLVCGAALLAVQIDDRLRQQETTAVPWYLQSAAFGFMIAAIMSMGGDLRSFIYFQF